MSQALLEILETKLTPWIDQFHLSQVVVARQRLAEMPLRPAFRYTPRKILGPRQGVQSFTFSENTAKWPRDHLLESPHPLLTFILEGNADMRFRDYWLHAREGQGVFALAHVPRKAGKIPYLHPERLANGYCLTINFSEVRGHVRIWLNRSQGNSHQDVQEIAPVYMLDNRSVQLLRQMQFHFVQKSSDDNPICLHLLKAFLLTLQDDLQTKRFVQAGILHEAEHHKNQGYDPIGEAQKYIRSHLREPLTLQSVAREVRMTRTQFAQQFKEETGQTFNQFVTTCRMEQAKVLLRETDYTLRFVHSQIGYRSLAHFTKIFQKTQNITPRQYREKYRQKIEDEATHP